MLEKFFENWRSKIVENTSLRFKTQVFSDRDHAGKLLAERLREYARTNVIVLAIPSGGVPIGYAISKELEVPLDLIVSRKIPLPYTKEAGFGAVTWEDTVVLNSSLVRQLNLTGRDVENSISKTMKEVEVKTRRFRGERPFPDLGGKTVILADDGLASGYTMLAAINFARKRELEKLIVAVPTAPMKSIELILPHIDKIFCLNIRNSFFFAVADAYVEWHDLADEEVIGYLRKASFWK